MEKPTMPLSAYLIYVLDTRDKLKSDNPGLSFTDIAKKQGESWSKMSEAEKSSYQVRSTALREEYDKKMVEYNNYLATTESSQAAVPKTSKKRVLKTAPKNNDDDDDGAEYASDISSDSEDDWMIKTSTKPRKEKITLKFIDTSSKIGNGRFQTKQEESTSNNNSASQMKSQEKSDEPKFDDDE
jgi:hypothetical protein